MFTKFFLYFTILLLTNSISFAETLRIDQTTNNNQLLPHTQIYIDKTKSLSLKDILTNKIKFQENRKDLLGFGYSPNFNVWVKFTLNNDSDHAVTKIIEYVNPLTTNLEFYDPAKGFKVQNGGMFHKQNSEITLNSIFKITLKAHTTQTYYLKATSYVTTLIIQLKLWNIENFYKKEMQHQIFLSLFFGAMFILGVYNLFIFFFTKDISYLYYVGYIAALIIHQLVYVGVAETYFFTPGQTELLTKLASLIVALPVFFLGLFTKSFLNTKQYKIYNTILNFLLLLIPLSIIFFLFNQEYDKYRNIFTMLLLIYLLYLTIFASLKKNQQAYFILFGWFVFVITGMLMYLSSLGIFSVYKYFPYLIEISFLLEAVIFSIALANKINHLQQEKNEANEQLILQKREETKKLEENVKEKTQDLQNALSEKNTLLKELNHRVKNNMQMIISLIRLQLNDVDDERLESYLKTIQNRISAMSHLHELLYKQENFTQIDTHEYFAIIINELKDSYGNNKVAIDLNVQTNLKIEEAIYCGLILNELITNSIKYAFDNDTNGKIEVILLQKDNGRYILQVKDNGKGYDIDKEFISLGLTLVDTLSTEQLDGSFKVVFNNGIESTISWKSYD